MGIYERIKAAAERKGMSISKIEKTLGLPRSSISKYNKNQPSAIKISQIANLLDTSSDYLLGESDDISSPMEQLARIASNIGKSLSDDEMKIIEAFRKVDEIDQRSVLRILGLADKKNEPQLLAAHERKGVNESNIEELRKNDIDML